MWISLLCIWSEKLLHAFLFGVLSMSGIGFILAPIPLKPVYSAWLRLSHLIGRMILIYYLVITPSGLMKRVIGGKPLPLKPDPEASSYWVTNPEPAQPQKRF